MLNLKNMYASLELFCDINWNNIHEEYKNISKEKSFPEYLQEKSLDGDCPEYIYEIAYYEQALFTLRHEKYSAPPHPGIWLNPSLHLLSLEFDVSKMLRNSKNGLIEIHQKNHILALYKNSDNIIFERVISKNDLKNLQLFEEGVALINDNPNQDLSLEMIQFLDRDLLIKVHSSKI